MRHPPFLAIDFETADNGRDSACAVGAVRVNQDGSLTRAVHLIRPPRQSETFRHIHGLAWSVLKDQEPFALVWPRVEPLLDGIDLIVAHNAPFDRDVLAKCCTAARIPCPPQPWACTLAMSRKRWPKPLRNTLPDVCARLNVPFRDHHEAGADAEAAARVYVLLREPAGPVTPPTHPAPCAGPYYAIGEEPPTRSDLKGSMRMLPFKRNERCPGWLHLWCEEGSAAWLPFPERVEVEESSYRAAEGRPAVQQTMFGEG